MLREATVAVEDHGAAAKAVRESLAALGRTAADREGTVARLNAVAEQLEGRARALADRVGRFKT
jgi:hypothetical protein